MKVLTCREFVSGSECIETGSKIKTIKKTRPARSLPVWKIGVASSSLQSAASRGKQAGGPPLQKQDDGGQHDDFAEHRAKMRLQNLVGDANAQGGGNGADKIADSADHHDHEAIDDVALAEARARYYRFAKGSARHSGQTGAEGESGHIHTVRTDAHAGGHLAILHHRADLQAPVKSWSSNSQVKHHDGDGKADDKNAVVGETNVGNDNIAA